jgi:hypothetical protein
VPLIPGFTGELRVALGDVNGDGVLDTVVCSGRGDDRVRARNHERELIRCGPGRDRATVDRSDRVRGCERTRRGH